jgi:hypothetical protein
MEYLKLFAFVLIGGLIFTACKDDEVVVCEDSPSNVNITVQPVFDAENLYLDSVYATAEGYDVQFTDIKFYMEDIKNGSSNLIDAALFDYRTRGTLLLNTEGTPDGFGSLTANLGVQSSVNHDDPAAFSNTSMLNIINSNDMHWGWNPGYIFVKIEAKVDTIQDGIPLFNHNVIFHIGKDENLQLLSFANLNWQSMGVDHTLPLKLDMALFLQNGAETIDLKTEYSSHTTAGQEALSMKVITNFRDAITTL